MLYKDAAYAGILVGRENLAGGPPDGSEKCKDAYDTGGANDAGQAEGGSNDEPAHCE